MTNRIKNLPNVSTEKSNNYLSWLHCFWYPECDMNLACRLFISDLFLLTLNTIVLFLSYSIWPYTFCLNSNRLSNVIMGQKDTAWEVSLLVFQHFPLDVTFLILMQLYISLTNSQALQKGQVYLHHEHVILFCGSSNLLFMGSGSFWRCRTGKKRSLATLFFRGDLLIFHLWPLLLNLESPRMSLDLVSDASQVWGYVALHLSNCIPFGIVTSSISLPGIVTNHLHPFFFFFHFFLKSKFL